MESAAADFEVLAGRRLKAQAAIDGAFATQAINTAHWRLIDGEIVRLDVAAARRAA